MRKIFTLIAVLVSVSCMSVAQDLRPAVKVAWDLTVPSTDIASINNGSGLEAGVLLNTTLYKGLYIEPGAEYFYNTMDVSYIDFMVNGRVPGPSGMIRNQGIRVPVMVGWKFGLASGMSMSVYTGPQLNFGMQMKSHTDAETADLSVKANANLYDLGWKKFDLQWKAGIRFHYLDNFFADIDIAAGINNILDSDKYKDRHLRRNTFSLGVGYMF